MRGTKARRVTADNSLYKLPAAGATPIPGSGKVPSYQSASGRSPAHIRESVANHLAQQGLRLALGFHQLLEISLIIRRGLHEIPRTRAAGSDGLLRRMQFFIVRGRNLGINNPMILHQLLDALDPLVSPPLPAQRGKNGRH